MSAADPRGPALPGVGARYVVPSYVERTRYGVKEMNPYNKLFEERVVFLGVQIDDVSANDVMAQLLTLESIDSEKDISIYINSPGGSFTSLMAIYDTMQHVQPEIQTICLGQASAAAAILLAGGSPGKRYALPHSRVMIHQPSSEGTGQGSDIEIQAREVQRMREEMEEIIAEHSGRDVAQVRRDIERNMILTAAAAKEYGIIDEIFHFTRKRHRPASVAEQTALETVA